MHQEDPSAASRVSPEAARRDVGGNGGRETATIEVVRRGSWLQLFSPGPFEWRRVHLPLANLPEPLAGLRIVHLTDLHMRTRWHDGYDALLAEIAANPPDLVLFTGDFLESRLLEPEAIANARRFIDGPVSRLGTYAILGNHDSDLLGPIAAGWKLELLDHRRAVLRSDDAALELIGLPGVDRLDLDDGVLSAIPPRDPAVPRIVMAHFPDEIRRIASLRASVMLAGHTHGGQCCLPGGAPLLTHDSLPRRYAKGVHRIDDTWLIVSRGLGFASLPMRTFCATEVVEIVLEAGRRTGQ